MSMSIFYQSAAEWGKFLLYVIFAILIIWGLVQKRRGNPGWASWIHGVILANFIIGGLYGGLRMLTTDPYTDMLIRRMFALEAWFCFAVASFYFYFIVKK